MMSSMRSHLRVCAYFMLLTPACLPLMAAETAGTCERDFQAGFVQGGSLNVHIRSAAVDLIGANRTDIKVTCELDKDEERRNVSIRFRPNGYTAKLDIEGGPRNNAHFRIEVPARANLYVRMPAGDLEIRGVTGDKDVELNAGDLTISGVTASDYRTADASIWAGDLIAGPFDINKDGLFRSFSAKNANGKYRLHAHLMAGDLTIR